MNRSASFFLLGLVAGILVATGGYAVFLGHGGRSGGTGTVRTLKLAHGLPARHPVHRGMVEMKRVLEDLSGGRMSLDLYPGGQLGSETECLEQVQGGLLAMTKSSTAPMEGFIDRLKVFGLPYLFTDEEHYWSVLEGEIGRELLEAGRGKNLLGLCYYDSGSRNFYTTRKMIRTPDDLKGMKIRVQQSPVAMKMIEAMGGAPTPISWGELYSSLAQGAVDGAENNAPSYLSEKHCEVAPYFTRDAHTRVPDMLLIGAGTWESLSGQEQEWLKQAATASSVFQRKLWKQENEAALEEAREKYGAKVHDPDKQLFMDTVQPVYDEFARGAVGELVTRIRAARPKPNTGD